MVSSRTSRGALLAVATGTLLTLTGCSGDVAGTASKQPGGGQAASSQPSSEPSTESSAPSSTPAGDGSVKQACDVLSTQDVSTAFKVRGAITTKQTDASTTGGVRTQGCQFINKNVIIGALQAGSGPDVLGLDGVFSNVKSGLAAGGDTSSTPVSGVGDRAEYLAKYGNGTKPAMISVQRRGSTFNMSILVFTRLPGVAVKQSLTSLSKTALAGM